MAQLPRPPVDVQLEKEKGTCLGLVVDSEGEPHKQIGQTKRPAGGPGRVFCNRSAAQLETAAKQAPEGKARKSE